MKNLIYLLLIALIFSCEKDDNTMNQVIEGFQKIGPSGCPENTTASIHYEFDEFRFKRPKFNCNSGFWFCTTNGGWVIECHDNFSGAVVEVISLSKVDTTSRKTTVAGIINYSNSTVDFYFPKELAYLEGNKLSDFNVFNVDNDTNINIIDGVTLIPGNYNTLIDDTEIIVSVDFD
ncbi:MAG: hypothetical protein CMC76_01725 [Flavobacteriaceae bacterium]|nr:hypothetical protein [Flavobacteriaceae bacterium]|tara:strand:- start:3165 stop:3692 length:528 start_codon:yes stop_codon:yes gene_type:complete